MRAIDPESNFNHRNNVEQQGNHIDNVGDYDGVGDKVIKLLGTLGTFYRWG